MTTLIKNGAVLTDEGVYKQDILIDDGIIRNISAQCTVAADNMVDAENCYVLPGLIDAHVHFHMLSGSRYTDDDFEVGTLGAARGGVTSVIDFARPILNKPPVEGLKARIQEAAGNSYTDFALHMSMQGWYSNTAVSCSELSELVDMGVSSLKFFTTYGETRIKDEMLEAMMPSMKKLGILPMIHAENDAVCTVAKSALIAQGKTTFRYHSMARPRAAEITEIEFLLTLAEKYDMPIYIAHVSTAEATELMRKARKRGVEILGETCPHYLVKTASVYETDEAALAIASPPLRTWEDTEALFEALEDGTLQCVSSDHCAFASNVKLTGTTFFDTPAGISGVETILPILYTYGVKSGRLSLKQMIKVTSENPARIFGLHTKGRISAGNDADLTVFDPSKRTLLSAKKLTSNSGYCLFEGMECTGSVKATLLRGTATYGYDAPRKTGQYLKCIPYRNT